MWYLPWKKQFLAVFVAALKSKSVWAVFSGGLAKRSELYQNLYVLLPKFELCPIFLVDKSNLKIVWFVNLVEYERVNFGLQHVRSVYEPICVRKQLSPYWTLWQVRVCISDDLDKNNNFLTRHNDVTPWHHWTLKWWLINITYSRQFSTVLLLG